MNAMKSILLVAAASALTGCAGLRGSAATAWPWHDASTGTRPLCQDLANCRPNDALQAYLSAVDYCRKLHAYYESGGRKNEGFQFGVGAAGMLAGSVFAPIAKGTAAKAWSGLSGATNAVQLSMEETFSLSVAVRRSVLVKKAAEDGAREFSKPGQTASDQVMTAVNMARSCAMAAAQADADSLDALKTGGK